MNLNVTFTGADRAVANLKAIDEAILGMIMDGLEEAGVEMAAEMNRADSLNVAHDTFTVQRRKKTVAVGPSKAGGRAHIVRFHEFGTAHHGATPIMRKVSDGFAAPLKAKMTRKVKELADSRKVR